MDYSVGLFPAYGLLKQLDERSILPSRMIC